MWNVTLRLMLWIVPQVAVLFSEATEPSRRRVYYSTYQRMKVVNISGNTAPQNKQKEKKYHIVQISVFSCDWKQCRAGNVYFDWCLSPPWQWRHGQEAPSLHRSRWQNWYDCSRQEAENRTITESGFWPSKACSRGPLLPARSHTERLNSLLN